jgi:hypothetical protein
MTREEIPREAKPIIFCPEMSRAIREGEKTQTRRVILPQPPEGTEIRGKDGKWHMYRESPPADATTGSPWGYEIRSKYMPGDILYVRETWNEAFEPDGVTHSHYVYKANGPRSAPWRPSIHMPKIAARTFLRVADVRAERLQETTETDAQSEGIPMTETWGCYGSLPGFEELWDRLNAKRGFGWDKNPWVFVYVFERIKEDAQ